MDSNIKSEIKKLSNLRQNTNVSEEALLKQAQQNVTIRQLVEEGNFVSDVEKKQAKKIFDSFLKTHNFETLSDLNTLSTLVYNMILLGRIQKSVNDCATKDGGTFISDKLVKSMHEVENQIDHLKVKLGIDRQEKTDEMTALGLLKKRFHQWLQENKASCTIAIPYTCSSCNHDDVKLVLLRKVVKDWTAIDHPAFLGRFYYSKYAMDMVEAGTLKKEDYAKIFQVSVDYVDWCRVNRGKIVVNDKLVDKKESKSEN